MKLSCLLTIAAFAFATALQAEPNLYDAAKASPSHKRFVEAIEAAGQVDTFSRSGPYTLFAPTDAAFEALPKGLMDELLRPQNTAELVRLLSYHIIPGVSATNEIKSGRVFTKAGPEVELRSNGTAVSINGVRVVEGDIKASNGIIHSIDRVLLPPR